MQKNVIQNPPTRKGNKLADWPIRTLILSMGMPMVLSMVLQAVYNIVDTIFVSHMENGDSTQSFHHREFHCPYFFLHEFPGIFFHLQTDCQNLQ